MNPARPLEGLRVLVTRARHQASDLMSMLEALGATPIAMPAIEIRPTDAPGPFDAALQDLATFDWVVLTSVNGVAAVVQRMDELGVPRSVLADRKLAVIGPATGGALARECRAPDLIPDLFMAESILDKLGDVRGQRFLLARADLARKELATGLKERGAVVSDVVAYCISPEAASGVRDIPGETPDILTFTSSAGVRNTVALLVEANREAWLRQVPIVCIGPITAATVRDLGYEVSAVATEYTIPGLVDAIVGFVGKREAAHA